MEAVAAEPEKETLGLESSLRDVGRTKKAEKADENGL
jgi:hypothetical protein